MGLPGTPLKAVASTCAAAVIAAVALLSPTAGPAQASPSPRIVNGTVNDRQANPTPWYVLLQIRTEHAGYSCGGTVIDPHWVLTAAHCARLGDVARSTLTVNPRTGTSGTRYHWRSVTIHPNFRLSTLNNDVALIRTWRKLPAVPMPFGAIAAAPTAGTDLTLYGFGLTNPAGNKLSKYLRTAHLIDLTGPTSPSCGVYPLAIPGMYRPHTMMCAGGASSNPDSGACKGDSGSGLIDARDPYVKPTVVGIVSWGLGRCSKRSRPTVFTRVSTFAAWITGVSGVASS